MIIGKFSSYITNPCKPPDSSSRYYRYINSSGGRQVIGYGSSCEAARQDWYKLVSRTPSALPAAKGGIGGTSVGSVKQAQGKPLYKPTTVNTKGNGVSGGGTSANSVKQAQGGKLNASGSSGGAGVSGGASISATVSDLQAKANQTASSIIPDFIEDKIPEGIPLWIIPAGLVGGLVLILLMRR